MKTVIAGLMAAIAASGVRASIWADGMASMSKWTDATRPQKHSRTNSHKQNARKAKRKGGAA